MPPRNGQNQGEGDKDSVSCRYGHVAAGSANFQGPEGESSFYFMPEPSEERMFKITGDLVAAAAVKHGREMFADDSSVTLVSHGSYSTQTKIAFIAPGRVAPVQALEKR